MYDPHSRESRGFGFVTMETGEEADAAITAMNATEFQGRVMTVEKVCVILHKIIFNLAYTIPQARRGRARTPTPGKYYGPPKRGKFLPPI
jgi:transformer-2 protein